MTLSKLGFGGEAIGGGPYRMVMPDREEALIAILYAIEQGVNWIDTAPTYGNGRSEEIIGEVIRRYKAKIEIATKCGLKYSSNNRVVRDARPKRIFHEINESLKRLKVSEIYLYQLHYPDPTVPILETWEAMQELVTIGKVRNIGVCNFNISLLNEISKKFPPFSLQHKYNIVDKSSEMDLIPFCREHKIRNIAYGVLHSGLLSETFKKEDLDPGDWRLREESWHTTPYAKMISDFNDNIKKIAKNKYESRAQLLINWAMHNPYIDNMIVGMRNKFQVEENIKALSLKLTSFENNGLNQLAQKLKVQGNDVPVRNNK